jgi:hypothetical protein
MCIWVRHGSELSWKRAAWSPRGSRDRAHPSACEPNRHCASSRRSAQETSHEGREYISEIPVCWPTLAMPMRQIRVELLPWRACLRTVARGDNTAYRTASQDALTKNLAEQATACGLVSQLLTPARCDGWPALGRRSGCMGSRNSSPSTPAERAVVRWLPRPRAPVPAHIRGGIGLTNRQGPAQLALEGALPRYLTPPRMRVSKSGVDTSAPLDGASEACTMASKDIMDEKEPSHVGNGVREAVRCPLACLPRGCPSP